MFVVARLSLSFSYLFLFQYWFLFLLIPYFNVFFKNNVLIYVSINIPPLLFFILPVQHFLIDVFLIILYVLNF
jgi:hypothetical protein